MKPNLGPPSSKSSLARLGTGMELLAGANIVNGQPVWSPFTRFGDDRFNITLNANGTSSDVGWDLTGTGFRGLFVFVESDELIANLYSIPVKSVVLGNRIY